MSDKSILLAATISVVPNGIDVERKNEDKLNHEFNGDEKTLDINEQSGKLAKNFLESCTNVTY